MNNTNYYRLLTMSVNLSSKELLKISDNIQNDKLIVKYNYIPESLNDIPAQLYFCKEFDWNIDFQEKTNMAMLHLHSLEPIKYLLLSYNKSKNIDLLYKSIEILISWNTHSHKKTIFYI